MIVRVAVIVNLMDPYNRRIMPGVADVARDRGWDLVIRNVHLATDLPEAVRGVDGLLLGVHGFESDPILTRTQLPAVCWSGSLVEVNCRRVMIDDIAVGREVADHFLARGFRNFVFFSDAPEVWSTRRRDGFLGRVEAAGYSADSIFISGAQLTTSADLVARLRTLPRPIGAMLAHDQSAIRFLAACHDAGLQVPGDIAIVGVNNDPFISEVCDPPLSSIAIRTERIGYEAATLLGKLFDKTPMTPWSIVVPPGDVFVRQSSDTLATSDQLVIDAVKFIRRELAVGVSTKEVASAMGVSRTTLDVRFTAAIGRTVAMEIRRERLDAARQLLASTDLAMPDIARRTGYASAQQLSESFSRFVRQTPTAYRKHFRTKPTK